MDANEENLTTENAQRRSIVGTRLRGIELLCVRESIRFNPWLTSVFIFPANTTETNEH